MGVAAAVGMVLCYRRTMPRQNKAHLLQWALQLGGETAWQLHAFLIAKWQATIINNLKQVPGQSAAASEERKRQHHWASRHALLWQRGGWMVGGESHLAAPCF